MAMATPLSPRPRFQHPKFGIDGVDGLNIVQEHVARRTRDAERPRHRARPRIRRRAGIEEEHMAIREVFASPARARRGSR